MEHQRIGQQFGTYRLIHLLGQGGQAEVYLAEKLPLGELVAIKLVSGDLTPSDLHTFQVEARRLSQLNHPHIVRVLEWGYAHQTPYLVMEYAKSGTLRDLYPRGSRLHLPLVLSLVKDIASALQYAHEKKLVHRDVKPENLLITAQNKIILSDFGIATTAHRTQSLKTQQAFGTVAYMAPEQIHGRPSPLSDQYALAVCVYEWLAGTPPFQGSNPMEVAMKQCNEPPASLRSQGITISAATERVLLRALSKEPHQRFPSCEAFAQALTHPVAFSPGTQMVTTLLSRLRKAPQQTSTERAWQTVQSHQTPIAQRERQADLAQDQDYHQLCQRMSVPDLLGRGTAVLRGDDLQAGRVVYLLDEKGWIRYPTMREHFAEVTLMKWYPTSSGKYIPAAIFRHALPTHTSFVAWIDMHRPILFTREEDTVLFADLRVWVPH